MDNDREGKRGVNGDENLYGLGVRIGFYLQWVGLLLAYYKVPSRYTDMLRNLSIFQLAFLISVIWKTAYPSPNQKLMDIEAFLATIYGIGGGLGALTYGAAQNSERLRVNRAETMCVNLLTLAYTLYAMWFWYWGIQQLDKLPYPACTFFFSRVSLYGWFTTFSKVMTTVTASASVLALLFRIWGIISNWPDRSAWLLGYPPSSGILEGQLTSKRLYLLCSFIFAFGTLIAIIEVTIVWNILTGVNSLKSAGQLIPLIVGIAGVVQVVGYYIFRSTADD